MENFEFEEYKPAYKPAMAMMFSTEDEREIIGNILINADKNPFAFDGLDDLGGKHFFDRMYGAAFDLMRDLYENGKPIDLFGVAEVLESLGASTTKLIDAMQNATGGKSVQYAKRVIDRSNAREARQLAQKFIDDLQECNGRDSNSLIIELVKNLDDLALSRVDNDATLDARELFDVGVEEYGKRIENGGGFVGLETGISSLDDRLMGLQGGSLYVMGGRPAMGKTAVSMTIAENIAEKYAEQGAVLVFNLEMSKEQLGLRTVAAASGVSLSDLQKGYEGNGGGNYDKLAACADRVIRRKMFVDVRADITVSKIRAKAKQIKNKHGLTLIVIDYLGLLEDTRRFENENARIAWMTRQIKKIAKELDVPILLLAQLSRKVEERSDKRPMMSDLRDSGAIEQDADAIIFNYRDGYYSQDSNDNMLELIVAKQRMGEAGTSYCCFEGQYSRVVDCTDDYVDSMFRRRNGGNGNGNSNGNGDGNEGFNFKPKTMRRSA